MVATITNSPSISVCKRKEPWFLRKEATTARMQNGVRDTTLPKSNGPIDHNSIAKIMQIECRTTSVLDCYAEMQLILYKDNANRTQKIKLA